MTEKILFVDDEENIISAYKRQLRKQFDVHTALGPEKGLAAIDSSEHYAVVVSDLRMPGMDGVRFLTAVRKNSPDTVRIMLTGFADVNAAIHAINVGNIFRFLTKPTEPEMLARTLRAALKQYRLVIAERELLEKTLRGSIKVLTEILSLVNPIAFSRAERLKRYVRHIAEQMNLANVWQFEMAAMLSQIGCVTLPPDTLQKIYAGATLTPEEENSFSSHPTIGRNLLADIPRLETIAEIIGHQQDTFDATAPATEANECDPITFGAQILKASLAFDRLISHNTPLPDALQQMRKSSAQTDPRILTALETLELTPGDMSVQMVTVQDLMPGMILDQDVHALNGLLLVGRGQEVTYAVLQRLAGFARKIGVKEPIRVLVPQNVAPA